MKNFPLVGPVALRTVVRAAAAVLLSLGAFACSGESGGDDENGGGAGGGGVVGFAKIEVSPNTQIGVSAALAEGATSEHVIQIRNTGEKKLKVEAIQFTYDPVSTDEKEGTPAFRLIEVRGCADGQCGVNKWDPATTDLTKLGKSTPLVVGIESDPTPFNYIEAVVRFTRPKTADKRAAQLIIKSNADNAASLTVTFSTAAVNATIKVLPTDVNFGLVQAGAEVLKPVTIANVGADTLTVSELQFKGSNFFTLKLDGKDYKPGDKVTLEQPIAIAPGGQKQFETVFAPTDGSPAQATIYVLSNAGNTPPDGEKVTLRGNEDPACIQVTPKTLNFGGKLVGQLSVLPLEIRSCGTTPLKVTGVALQDGSSPDFALDTSSIPGFEDGSAPSDEKPVVLGPNQTVELNVRFVPDAVNPLDENAFPIPDVGTIVIKNNTFQSELPVKVQGVGVDVLCPMAVITVEEGEEVIPQTTLHLRGDESFSQNGQIIKWEWSVEQPVGSVSIFVPSNTFPTPTFEVNVAGVYLFRLQVWDESGDVSCIPAEAEVLVVPDEAIHVELLWNTPNDADQTDEGPEAGADVDLHFLHPFAGGPDLDGDGKPDGWFDQPFDCFWFNPAPQWGSFDPFIDDDPSLDRDDTDGAGPENLNLNIPENGKTYRVGVHYWNDHGYGASFATLKVYIYSQLVFELADVKLEHHDMWEVCTIDWPTGKVKQILDTNGSYKITPKYTNPFFSPGG